MAVADAALLGAEIQEEEGPDYEALIAFLRDEETRSYDSNLMDERMNALDYYNGEPFGDEEDGKSQIVTRDVAEVIDYMTVSLLRTMVSGDQVVEFEHPNKQVAEEATALVSREFFQGQDGYSVIHDWIKAGLLEKSSVVKCCIEERAPLRREEVLSVEEIAVMADQGVQFIQHADMGDGSFAVAWLEPQPPYLQDYVVPNEEHGFAADARDLDKACVYSVFKTRKTVSELAEMGFDVSELSGDNADDFNSLARARDGGNNETAFDYRTGPNRAVWFYEEYARYDLDGDGIAELLKCQRVGTTMLDVEPIDEQPGVIWCPFPMPGRLVGQSLADKVMDIQRTRSVLMRQGLDNLYQTNNPRWTLSESATGDTTIDDLLTTNRPGGIIRHIGPQGPVPVSLPFSAQSAFEVMEVLNGEKESRTGITRLNQGLDADTLNKTATGTALMQAQGQQIEEYLARNFAEAFARLMLKKFRLLCRFGQPTTISIDGEEREVDPRQWPEDMNVRVRVGLGTGRKDERVQNRMMLLGLQKEAAMSDIPIKPEHIFNSVAALVKDLGLGVPTDYWPAPSPEDDQQQQPDPAVIEAQAKAAEAEQKVELERQKAAASLDLERQRSAAQLDLEREKNALKMQIEADKARQQAELAEQKAAFEADLARRKMAFQEELAVMQAERQAELAEKQADASIPQNRPGGDLDK